MTKLKVFLAKEDSGISVESLRTIAAARDFSPQIIQSHDEFERIFQDNSDDCVVLFDKQAANLYAPPSINRGQDKRIDERLQKILIMVGIPSHIKGSKFLRDAIKTSMSSPDMINNITKQLYPAIAEKNNTTASKVERAIRHAIEVSWNRGKIENINNIFGLKVFSKGEKPTNGELIALIADKILIEFSA